MQETHVLPRAFHAMPAHTKLRVQHTPTHLWQVQASSSQVRHQQQPVGAVTGRLKDGSSL